MTKQNMHTVSVDIFPDPSALLMIRWRTEACKNVFYLNHRVFSILYND